MMQYLHLTYPCLLLLWLGCARHKDNSRSCVLIETDDSHWIVLMLLLAVSLSMSVKKQASASELVELEPSEAQSEVGMLTIQELFRSTKCFQAATRSCSQGGVRNGAATLYYPIWHLEVEDLLVLKNNKGTEDNRVRHMDYGVQFSKLMYERLLSGGDITLFSPSDVPASMKLFSTIKKSLNTYTKKQKFTQIFVRKQYLLFNYFLRLWKKEKIRGVSIL